MVEIGGMDQGGIPQFNECFTGIFIEPVIVCFEMHKTFPSQDLSVFFEENRVGQPLLDPAFLGLWIRERDPYFGNLALLKIVQNIFNLDPEKAYIGYLFLQRCFRSPPDPVTLEIHTYKIFVWEMTGHIHSVFTFSAG